MKAHIKQPSHRVKLDIDRIIAEFQGGIHRSKMSGLGMEFKGIRPYDPSDKLSQIDWLTSARLSEDDSDLVSKDFHPEKKITVICLVDSTVSMRVPEKKGEITSFLIWLFALSTFKYRDRFRLVFFSPSKVKSSEWVYTENDLLGQNYTQWDTEVRSYLNLLELRNTLLIVISDFGPKGSIGAEILQPLGMVEKNINALFFALDEWDGFKTRNFTLQARDPESGIISVLDLRPGCDADKQVKKQKKRFEEISRSLRPLGVPFIPISLIRNYSREIQRGLLREGFE